MSGSRQVDHAAWAAGLEARLLPWLDSLQRGQDVGSYRLCISGLTPAGQRLELGPSCFAVKVLVTLGRWDTRPAAEREAWVTRLQSFQLEAPRGPAAAGMFHDPAMADAGAAGGGKEKRNSAWRNPRRWWRQRVAGRQQLWAYRVALAETKQAVATLAEVGGHPRRSVEGLPDSPAALRRRLAEQDWSRPWAAGGQSSALVTLLMAAAPLPAACSSSPLSPATPPPPAAAAMRESCTQQFDRLADPTTGAYFTGPTPPPHELINGAMKVLTALHWLDQPIHHPRKLIDLCLDSAVRPEGCDLVDVIYVLHRCQAQEHHRAAEVRQRGVELLEQVRRHEHAAGGFSYYPGMAQTTYYRLPVSEGHDTADLHGTCLLLWAAALALDLRGELPAGWRLIRP